MRNLARLLLARGVAVQGSDLRASASTEDLRELGARIWIGHDAAHVLEQPRPDAVVVSSAIAPTNEERAAATAAGIPVWFRQQAIAAIAADRRRVAVAGTHGKTTTTSMIATALTSAGLEPTYLIGGDLHESGGGAAHGAGELFVYEADESDGSFLVGDAPWVGVVTNIEVDHVDFYPGGLPEIEAAFAAFAARAEHLVVCSDDPSVRRVVEGLPRVVTYGTDTGATFRLEVTALGPEGARGSVGTPSGPIDLRLPIDGPHNLLDATAAVAVGVLAGVPAEVTAEALRGFGGVHRRFELRGRARGAAFYDDYGHTPTEMAVTIETARRRAPRRLIALVQPHRYTRVQTMWRELGASVAAADLIVVSDVYGAAQAPIPGVTGRLVADGALAARPEADVVYVPHRDELVAYLAREVREGDLVITMGCGDVWMLGDAVRERIEELDA